MFKQDHHLQSRGTDAVSEDELRHVLIPACELGIERYQEFRTANPHWRPRSYIQGPGSEGLNFCEGCRECVSTSKPTNMKPQLTVECSGLSKVSTKPISVSFSNLCHHSRMPMDENMMSAHAIHSPVVIKATQQYASKGAALEEMAMVKSPLVKPTGREVSPPEDMELKMKSTAGDDHSDRDDSGRTKGSDVAIMQGAMSEHATSSDDLSENMRTPSQIDDVSFSDHAVCAPQGDSIAVAKGSKFPSSMRVDEHMIVDDEDLFNYVLATRQIPYGHSYSNLDVAMQRRLHDYFKQNCPPCPHCNCNSYVKFRYFNNSGKSSLLQPRYSCRNPHTCITTQEKTGKAGSRDFTLQKPKETETHKGLAMLATHEHGSGLHGKSVRQPQMIARSGAKRPAHTVNLSEAGERSAKLPNTTLSLQSLNGPAVDVPNLQIVETSKERVFPQAGKQTEDSNSSSSTRTASDEQTAINVRCRAEASSENGRLVVQPISVQKVVPTAGKGEAGTTTDRPSKGGKIAELNICMYIDLSTASPC